MHSSLPAIKGLFLFSPALKLNSSWAFLAGTASLFGDWMAERSDRDYAAYESFAYNAAAQSYQLIQKTKHRFMAQESFPVPVFIALSEDDGSVDSKYPINIFRDYLNNRSNWMQLYTADPQTYARDPRIEALQSRIEDKNIISFSHTSITVPASHRHYDASGDYHRCVHYREQLKPWLACTSEPVSFRRKQANHYLKSTQFAS